MRWSRSSAPQCRRNPDVVWILAVGSDARPGEEMTRTRGDALQLIGINTKTGAATAIGIPRDSCVPIPGDGIEPGQRGLYFGGPQLLGETVGNLIGIQPDYVFVTGFKKFKAMVDDIGGIDVLNPGAVQRHLPKPRASRPGRSTSAATPPWRSRGSARPCLGGDFDRSANQQRVLRGIQAKVRDRAEQPRLHRERRAQRDGEHGDRRLARRAVPARAGHRAGGPAKITTCVVLGGIGNVGGASVVLPYVDQARSYGDEAREDATIERC